MATYIETADNTIYQLDATTDIKYTDTSKVTQNPISSGGTTSDHVTQNPITVSFTGILTRQKAKGRNSQYVKDSAEYITALQAIKKNAELVKITVMQPTIKVGSSGEKDIIDPLSSCVITSLNFSKQSGSKAGEVTVSVVATQVILSEQSEVTQAKVPTAEFTNDASGKATGAGGTNALGATDPLLIDISAGLDATGIISSVAGALN